MTAQAELLTLSALARALIRRRRIIAGVVVFCLIVSAAMYFLQPRIYESSVKLLPQVQTADTGLIGKIASFSGTPLGGDSSYEGLYQQILESDRLLDRLLDRSFAANGSADSVSVFTLLGFEEADRADPEMIVQAKRKLRDDVIFFSRDKLSGYMVLTIQMGVAPNIPADVANYLVQELDIYNRSFRKLKARENSEFIASRLAEAEVSLRQSEKELATFVQANRRYVESPILLQAYNELDREVQANYAIWVDLRRQLETSRIEESKETVSLDILDPAIPNPEWVKPRLAVLAFAGLFFGVLFGIILAFVRDQWALTREFFKSA